MNVDLAQMAQLRDELGDVHPRPAVDLGRILPSHHRHPHSVDRNRHGKLPQDCFGRDDAKYLDSQPVRSLINGTNG
jgi:hypothetical protein